MRSDATFFTLALIMAYFGTTAAKGCPYSIKRYGEEVKWDIIEAGTSHIRVVNGIGATIIAKKNCKLSLKGLPRFEYTISRGDSINRQS
ncbi:hypothetical protein PgNI_11048 [Pyricularia grisea]|uniref:Uncharacterized protein n=1 Tax=Pyricularia grisea TaxID=148305 RepID=A0A6P8AZ15_PYRGI|nr:hypothetical protein PgNI_11048 [Pyricularia grisea]TLD07618.1 hypothetical protein PgNI_11048 [Pyricularia grisea]